MFENRNGKFNREKFKLSENLESMNAEGTYTLVISVPAELDMKVGGLGMRRFPGGYYAYTGSALGKGALSLGGRVERHLTKNKKKRWHIDYLLSESNVTVAAVVFVETKKRIECEINSHLKEKLQAKLPVTGFGASDCRENCGSHLLYLGLDEKVVRQIVEIYPRKTKRDVHVLELYRDSKSRW